MRTKHIILSLILFFSLDGKFESINDFINRVNPKDINKLQLEGLVQAGVFDIFTKNRQSLFNSIPNIILKSKNIYENKMLNQINLFEENENEEINFLDKIEDWNLDVKLNKEFETLGFYISDHPLNQYKSVFNQYNIISFDTFENNKDIISSNVACTVLKVQEKKTQKGSSYAIVKFSDISNVFELFIFSDIFEKNREILTEGNSLILTLIKNYSDQENDQKRINVKKMTSLNEIINTPIKNITFKFDNLNELQKLKDLKTENAKTNVKVIFNTNNEILTFTLKNKRKINNQLLNSLNLMENVIAE